MGQGGESGHLVSASLVSYNNWWRERIAHKSLFYTFISSWLRCPRLETGKSCCQLMKQRCTLPGSTALGTAKAGVTPCSCKLLLFFYLTCPADGLAMPHTSPGLHFNLSHQRDVFQTSHPWTFSKIGLSQQDSRGWFELDTLHSSCCRNQTCSGTDWTASAVCTHKHNRSGLTGWAGSLLAQPSFCSSLSPLNWVTILGTVSGLGYALVALIWRVPMNQPAPARVHS